MVSEAAPNPQVLQVIQDTITAKAWYGLSESGAFNWPISVGKMTESLQSSLSWDTPDLFEIVRESLESAFTPECLTRLGNRPFVTKLAELARAHGNDLTVWTVGDVGWQINKAERVGLFFNGVIRENFICSAEDKREGLRSILHGIRAQTSYGSPIHVFVLDDKEASIRDVRSLSRDASALDIVLHDFLVKLDVPGASVKDAYAFLQRETAAAGKHVSIVSDFDGVLANTDSALKDRGARNIYGAYIRSATP